MALLAALREDVTWASSAAVALLVPAALVDVHERRLPNALVGAAATSFGALLVVDLLLGGAADARSALVGLTVFAGPLLAVHLVTPAAMGFGDVKAALVLGLALGAVEWQLALVGLALATGLTAVIGILGRARTVAFGPGLVAGAALALCMATVFVPAGHPTATSSRAHGAPVATHLLTTESRP